MIKKSEVLRAAKAKIEDTKHWTQGVCARDANGRVSDILMENAVCWCAIGAVLHVTMSDNIASSALGAEFLLDKAAQNTFGVMPDPMGKRAAAVFNDTHSHPDVMALFNAAIGFAELEEAVQS